MGAQGVLFRLPSHINRHTLLLLSAMAAMKAMKAMKVAKAMKAMTAMKAVKKVSARLAKRRAFAGKTAKTSGGLTKNDLVKNKAGKIVSKKASARAKKSPWIAAVQAARKALGVKGFAAIKKGSPLYNKAKALYKK